MRIFLKRAVAVASLLAMSMAVLCGCDGKSEENVETYITTIISETNEAIQKKDAKKATEICSSLTELSVQLEKQKDITFSKIVSDLAGNYSYLLEYCLGEDEEKLQLFYKGMESSGNLLIEELNNRGYATENILREIENIDEI